MESRIINLIVVCLILLLIDYYVFQAVKVSISNSKPNKRKWILRTYWFIVGMTIAGVFLGLFLSIGRGLRTLLFVWFFIHYFSKIFALPFIFIDDLRRGLSWLSKKLGISSKSQLPNHLDSKEPLMENTLSRSEFLSKSAIVMASIPFATMNYGLISNNVYDYQIKRRTIYLPNLPKSFDGIKIGQISDIHAGSFDNDLAVKGGVDMLNAEKCDIVFFTGDLVNEDTKEISNYMQTFEKVSAPLGVFSIFGNHDYGDYKQWPSIEAKKQNLTDLVKVHQNLGWNLLRNENKIITLNGDSIAIVGIENWSSSNRFPKKGRLDLATQGLEDAQVQLLLSHDPSHWRAQVIGNYPDIDMMFAGHTHGMQFGVQFGEFQWSPVQYVYPEWSGLYQEGKQKLYVNVGYGFLGYPGRIGILPEISIFELKCQKS